MTNEPDLARLIMDAKSARDMSYDDLAKACGGVPARQRLFQMASVPIKSFPGADSIEGLSRGLGISITEVIMACARSVGLNVRGNDVDTIHISGLSRYPPEILDAYKALGQQIAKHAVSNK